MKFNVHQINQLGKPKTRKKRRSKFDISNVYNLSDRSPTTSQNNSADRNCDPQHGSNVLSDQILDLKPQQLRRSFTDEQVLILEAAYQKNTKPCNTKKALIAELCDLPFETVRIWYQNRRAKEKRIQEDELALLAEKYNTSNANEHLKKLDDRINSIFNSNHDDEDNEEEETLIRQLLRLEKNGLAKDKTSRKRTAEKDSFDCYQREIEREESVINALLNQNNNENVFRSKREKRQERAKSNSDNLAGNSFQRNNQEHNIFNGNITNNTANFSLQNSYQNLQPHLWNNLITQPRNFFPWTSVPETHSNNFPNFLHIDSNFRNPFMPSNMPFPLNIPPPPLFPPFQDMLSPYSVLHQLQAIGIPLTPEQRQFLGMPSEQDATRVKTEVQGANTEFPNNNGTKTNFRSQYSSNIPQENPNDTHRFNLGLPTLNNDFNKPTQEQLNLSNQEQRHPRSWYLPEGIPQHLISIKREDFGNNEHGNEDK